MDLSSPARIRERLRICEAEVVSLKRMLNAHAPVNKLPRELLALIFSLRLPRAWGYGDKNFHGFLGLSQVCSMWRSIAIDTPTLWAVLPCGNTAITSMAFQRSKQAQLDISLWPSNLNNERQLQLSRQILDTSRLRSLEMHFSCSHFAKLKAELSRAAPLLRTLSMMAYIDFDDTVQTLDLFNGETPRLRTLSLIGFLRFFRQLDLRQLQSLHLQSSLEKISPFQLVDALRGMPKLQLMDLDGIFDFTSGNLVSLVHVQHLQRLYIHDHCEPLMTFIQHIDSPALLGVQLEVNVALQDMDVDTIAGFQIIRSFRQRHGGALQYISVTDDTDHIKLVAANDESGDSLEEVMTPNGVGQFEVLIEQDEREERNPQDANNLLKLATLFEIRSLDLWPMSDYEITAEIWLDTFTHVSHTLCDVKVSETSAPGLIAALGLRIDGATPSSENNCLFLAGLEHLRLHSVDFTYPFVTHKFGSCLRKTMQTRASEGLRGLTIHLYGCRHFLADVQAIKEAGWVKDVEWDGEGEESDSETSYGDSGFSMGNAEDSEGLQD
jgi:hypothetical protein